ncbi:MAG: hypothetical protein D6705_01655 [Deltaproteobacteria bacterium]|nr:MAG: hypothetical protein D6705_01655 [Deltaproteobacteria bacterium]
MSHPSFEPETLSAYHDGELPPEDAARVEAALRADPKLARETEAIDELGTALRAVLEADANDVPDARFEQIWDAIEREIDAQVAPESTGLVARLRAWWGGAWARPALAVAGVSVASLALFFALRDPPRDAQDTQVAAGRPTPAQAEPSPEPPPAKAGVPSGDVAQPVAAPTPGGPPALAAATVEDDASNEAEVEFIEFQGSSGRIERIEGRRGTTTVIWVREDEPVDTERDL